MENRYVTFNELEAMKRFVAKLSTEALELMPCMIKNQIRINKYKYPLD